MYITKIQNTITQKNYINNTNNRNKQMLSNSISIMNNPVVDTVCFRGTPKGADKASEITRAAATQIHRALKPSEQKLVHFIETHFSDLLVSTKEPKNPLIAIKHRLKSANSIKEKSGTRKWLPQEVIHEMTDLLGMKFELRTSDKQCVEGVLDRFIPLIRSRKIELLEIENKRPGILQSCPQNERDKYDYASVKFLEKMIKIQEETWGNAHQSGKKQRVSQHLEDDYTPVNYNAIHMLFRIPGKNSLVFELQIMGKDMAAAKNIDDKAYKLLEGKDIDKIYGDVKSIFQPFTNEKFFQNEPNAKEIVDNARAVYKKYRQELFLFQRKKEPSAYSKKKNVERFLPLAYKLFPSEIELKYSINSSDFDFNNLYELIEKADRRASQIAKARKDASLVLNKSFFY